MPGFQTFFHEHLNMLPPDSEAFHAQLYPYAYPTDKHAHDLRKRSLDWPQEYTDELAAYCAMIRPLEQKMVRLTRLRLLPANIGDAAVMAEVAGITSRLGREDVRVALHKDQRQRLLGSGVTSRLVSLFDEPVSSASFWSLRPNGDPNQPPSHIAIMSYNYDGTFNGFDPHQPTPEEQDYEAFWRHTFSDASQSVAIDDWRQLYD